MTLYQLTQEQQAIEDALYENGGELTEELATAMDENCTSIENKLAGYNSFIRNLEATENAADAEIKRLQGIKKSARNAKDNIKAHLLFVMQTMGIDKIDGQTCKASIRRTKSLEVNEDELLMPFLSDIEAISTRLPQYCSVEIKVNKTVLKDLFKGTDALPAGCTMVENESVTLR